MKFSLSLPKLRLSSSRKARSKAMTLSLIVGIVTFGLATVGEKIATGKVTSIVVAATDLKAGQVISEKNLTDEGKVSGVLPPDVYVKKEDIVGLSLAYPVKAGQPIVKGLVSDKPQRDGLYPGEVGAWVAVTLTSSGMAKPGDIVDVYLSSSSNEWGKVNAPQMVNSLQGVRVVAVVNNSGQPVKADSNNPNGNVPVAVELAIPSSKAQEFSKIAAGRVSLMQNPFGAPQTVIDKVSAPPTYESTGNPNPAEISPNAPNSMDNSLSLPSDSMSSPPQNPENSQPKTAADTVGSVGVEGTTVLGTTGGYTPPLYNPTSPESKNAN